MKKLWVLLDKSDLKTKTKNTVYITINILVSTILGALLWLLVGRLILPGVAWLICFMGYPAVFIGLFGSSLYLYKHEFL